MGSITFDSRTVEFDDRTLAHLQVVIVQRFRAGSSVLMSWLDPLKVGDGRSAVWLAPGSIVHFKFAGSRSPAIDRAWIEALSRSADAGSGLIVAAEDGHLIHAQDHYPSNRGI